MIYKTTPLRHIKVYHFQKIVPNISKKVLSEHLRILEKNKLISRTVYPKVPPKVEYKITTKRKSLSFVFEELEKWGRENLES